MSEKPHNERLCKAMDTCELNQYTSADSAKNFYAYDGNGNVCKLIGTNGAIVALYAYDPFGDTLAQSGTLSDENPFRFSTKYYDQESGLYYYGYRFYGPELARFISRDPIRKWASANCYVFVKNRGPNGFDLLGLLESCCCNPEDAKAKDETAVWASGTSFEYQGFSPIDMPAHYTGPITSFLCKWQRIVSVEMECPDADVWCSHCGTYELEVTATFGPGGFAEYNYGTLTKDVENEVDDLCREKAPEGSFGDPAEEVLVGDWSDPPSCKK